MNDVMDVLGVRVSVTNLDDACQRILSWITQQQKNYVCVAPVSTIMEAQDDKEFFDIVNHAGLVTPDGMPLVWTGKIRGQKGIERTYGPDLLLKLCDEGRKTGMRHFFYGGTQGANERLVDNLKSRFPGINIVGHWAPPFRDKGQKEELAVITMINNASADILWVGLGAPKQEYWMRDHRQELKAPVLIGVGAAFDFLSGEKRQAPPWMRRCGLEWLFRLGCEPKRLWKRYIIGNTRFVFLSIAAMIKMKTKKALS